MAKRSKLELLLEKNAYGAGLTSEEKVKAFHLIKNPKYTKEKCWVCRTVYDGRHKIKPAIYDTGLCQGHALYALATRK